MGLLQRLEQILERKGWGQRELARKAGLDEKHVSVLMFRLRKNPNATADVKTLRAIAEAAGESFEWLSTGVGDESEAPSNLESALSQAFDGTKHLLRDAEAVKAVLRTSVRSEAVNSDLLEAARAWLDAAASLRRDDQDVTIESLLTRLALGKRPMQHQVAIRTEQQERLRREIAADIQARGVEPKAATELGARIAEKLKRLLQTSD